MKKYLGLVISMLLISAATFISAPKAEAVIVDSGSISIIDSTDIINFPSPTPSGSGLGTLDLNMFQQGSGGASNNPSGPLNFDDANTDMPSGGSSTIANESYITSIGDLRDFYDLNFGVGNVNEIVLFLNINETGGLQDILLSKLDVVIDYTSPTSGGRSTPLASDISSGTQNSTNAGFDGGTRIAKLGAGTPFSIPQIATGLGHIDQFILTGINPFDPAYTASTRILFHWESSAHSAGGEVVFLSGDFRKEDVIHNGGGGNGVVPEPASLSFLGFGLLGLAKLRKKR